MMEMFASGTADKSRTPPSLISSSWMDSSKKKVVMRQAAEIAVRTVRGRLDAAEPDMTVVFNVFSEEDERIYRGLLGM